MGAGHGGVLAGRGLRFQGARAFRGRRGSGHCRGGARDGQSALERRPAADPRISGAGRAGGVLRSSPAPPTWGSDSPRAPSVKRTARERLERLMQWCVLIGFALVFVAAILLEPLLTPFIPSPVSGPISPALILIRAGICLLRWPASYLWTELRRRRLELDADAGEGLAVGVLGSRGDGLWKLGESGGGRSHERLAGGTCNSRRYGADGGPWRPCGSAGAHGAPASGNPPPWWRRPASRQPPRVSHKREAGRPWRRSARGRASNQQTGLLMRHLLRPAFNGGPFPSPPVRSG